MEGSRIHSFELKSSDVSRYIQRLIQNKEIKHFYEQTFLNQFQGSNFTSTRIIIQKTGEENIYDHFEKVIAHALRQQNTATEKQASKVISLPHTALSLI